MIYAAFPRPKTEENFLADIEHYSIIFTADAAKLILQELGMPQAKINFVRNHRKFFGSKERTLRFKQIYTADHNADPTLIILAVLTKVVQPKATTILSAVFQKGLVNNPLFSEFKKYNVEQDFWQFIANEFGYPSGEQLDLTFLIAALLLNYAYYQMGLALPAKLENYQLQNINNVISYVKSLSDSTSSRQFYDQASNEIWGKLNLEMIFQSLPIEQLVKCDTFAGNEKLI